MRRNQFFSDLFGIQRSRLADEHPSSASANAALVSTAHSAEGCLSPAFSLQRSPPIDGSMGAIRGFIPMSPVSTAPHRTYPGELIVRTHPRNDLDMPSAYWSDIASTLLGREISLRGGDETMLFEHGMLLQSAYQVALQSISSPSSLKASGLPVDAPSTYATTLNNIVLPALRDLVTERVIAGEPVSEDVMLAALLQFVPARERATFFAAFCPSQGAAIEELIGLSSRALLAPLGQDTPQAYSRVREASDELAAWTHLVKSYYVMAAHLCAPNESSQVRKTAYAMNDAFGANNSPSAHERIINRGQVLESIGW